MLSAQAIEAIKRTRRRFVPAERLGYDEWPVKYRVLPDGRRPGPFRFEGQPALRGILAMLNKPTVRQLWGQKCSRFGWTHGVGLNVIGRRIHLDPCAMMVMFPKDGAGKRFMREKFVPTIKATPALNNLIDVEKRGPHNTQDYKEFPGGYLQLFGANSPSNVKSSDFKVGLVEEPDDTSTDVEGQGDSVTLVYERLKDHPDHLLVVGGTPTIEGLSKIAAGMEKTDKCRFMVRCPHCGHRQTLRFSRVRWKKDALISHPIYGTHRAETSVYACEACVTDDEDFTSPGCWTDTVKNRLVQAASEEPENDQGCHGWVATAPFTGAAGVYIDELMSVSLGSVMRLQVQKFLEADHELKRGNDKPMRSFVNNQRGETWRLKNDAPEVTQLKSRAAEYAPWTTPAGGLIATGAVDVQRGGTKIAAGLYLKAKAWGRGEESWLVAYVHVPGNPLDPATWLALDAVLKTPIRNAGGGVIGISALSIDSADGMTQEAVYAYVRDRKHLNYMAIKGSSDPLREIFTPPSKLVDTTATDKASKFGLKLFTVGKTRAFDLIAGRIKLAGDGPGCMHWHNQVPDDYYEQLTSQVKAPGKNGKYFYQTKEGVRAEAAHLEAYNLHAARKLRLHTFREADWAAIEARIRQPDLLAAQAERDTPTTVGSGPRGTSQIAPPGAAPFTGFGAGRRGI